MIAAFALATAACGVARADDRAVDLYGTANSSRVERIVEPEYPREALARGLTGYVDVSGRVNGMHEIEDLQFHAGSPDAEVFVPGLRDVAKLWLFRPDLAGDTCFPAKQRMEVRVLFGIEDGKPRVAVEAAHASPSMKNEKTLHPQCPRPYYPVNALRSGYIANVYTRLNIAADGTVSSVQADVYTKGQAGSDLFADSVKANLGKCHFDPADDPQARRAACYEVQFRTRE